MFTIFYGMFRICMCSNIESRYFGRGTNPCGHVDTNSVLLKHRDSLESSFSGAEWVGPRTQDHKVPGSIPGSCRSLFGHLLVMSGSLFRSLLVMLGCVWGVFSDIFRWVWEGFEKSCENVKHTSNNTNYRIWPGVIVQRRAAQSNYS